MSQEKVDRYKKKSEPQEDHEKERSSITSAVVLWPCWLWRWWDGSDIQPSGCTRTAGLWRLLR